MFQIKDVGFQEIYILYHVLVLYTLFWWNLSSKIELHV